ncbi:uncharacterized protein LOC118201928 [Stegodyphus dumicola]|uniref:uncharacterized protein LOC118201928 n=1 Tax=Stegodyphus dumicola TaxID=202533 RepID=UPI0015ACA17A|nr:uncharacterized protein LOC118201928 [Stegodyphus dumicola]
MIFSLFVSESVSKGIPVEKLLDGIRDSQSPKDHFQLHLLKKKDFRSINNAYNCEEYNNGLSDAESVDHWVRLCCQMENSPILAYRQEDFVNEDGRQDEFLLIIMTEFQKHILLTSNKEVVCVDSLFRKKGSRFYLTVLFIMDEHDLAFPVAFCISSKVDRYVITKFFEAIKQSTGPLSATYFMSDSLSLYYDAWREIMNDEAKWLWSMWYVDSRIRVQMRIFKGNTAKRADVYKTMRTLLECQNETVFCVMFENFLENLLNDPQSRELGIFIKQHYGCNQEMWAYCYRKDINLSTNIHLEIMHRTFRYCCREGRKKRLDKFIFVLMKLVRDKVLDRLSNSVDEEKLNLAHESINACHSLGLEIPADEISALSEKIWLIRSDEENFYVSRELMTCPEHCNLKCEECDICVHMFTCNCIHNLINANLCPHIHAVVWNFLTPHFTHSVSDQGTVDESVDDNVIINTKDSSELFSSVLKKTHDLYKNIQSNKCNLNKESLNALLKRLNECIDVCNGKVPDTSRQAEKIERSTPSSTVLYVKNNVSQPLILPNHFPNALPQTTPLSQYVILLPSSK